MTATRGSWNLSKAILCRFIDSGADAAIRGLWPDIAKQSQYLALNDSEARPGTPAPYIVLTMGEPLPLFRSSGKTSSTEIEHWLVSAQFECFGPSSKDSPLTITAAKKAVLDAHFSSKGKTRTVEARAYSSKEAAQLCAEICALAFDNQSLDVENDGHQQTFRGSDFPVRHDDRHHSWVLRYQFQIEATYDQSPTP